MEQKRQFRGLPERQAIFFVSIVARIRHTILTTIMIPGGTIQNHVTCTYVYSDLVPPCATV